MSDYQTRVPRTQPSELSAYIGWLTGTDHHATYHLSLIQKVEHYLRTAQRVTAESRSLADKLERWRYQHLEEHLPDLTEQDEAFAAALNSAANQLVGRTDLSQRQTLAAIRDHSATTDLMQQAELLLDPGYDLEQLCMQSRCATVKSFCCGGAMDVASQARWPVLLYAPLYVSNYCVNHCNYCGFRYPLQIDRRHLSLDEVDRQIELLQQLGFGHLLIVGGEYPQLTTTSYYCDISQLLVRREITPAIEIAPQSSQSYRELAEAGVRGVTLYQETYDERLYDSHHPRGPKANYLWRLESHDRAAEAGMKRLGLGILLGLADPHQDFLALVRHGAYLADRFPACTLAFSLPRLHEAPEGFTIPYSVTDEQLIRYYSTLRVLFPEAELVLSTRETAALRDRLVGVGITQMSAGSCTSPGGYGKEEGMSGEQFPISDHRSPGEVADWLKSHGYEVRWAL
jgi:2-iminoacetate synthase